MLLYATVPGFYAEVERTANPGLQDRPVIVGGDPRKRGLVQSATPDAPTMGLRVGSPLLESSARIPQAPAFRTDMRLYRDDVPRLPAGCRHLTGPSQPACRDASLLDPPKPVHPA